MSGTAVCQGATLRCSCGAAPSRLKTSPHSVGPNLTLDFATVADSKPYVHILPFGTCSAPAHPLAAMGSPPCTPLTVGLWQIRVPSVRFDQVQALRSDATLACAYGGVIGVVMPGMTNTRLLEQGE